MQRSTLLQIFKTATQRWLERDAFEGVTTVLFGMLFKVLPDVRIQWADAWRGAFITAVLFAIGKYCISLYLTHVAPASAYGAAGSLVLILLWVYYSSLILFFGTCLTIVTILQRGEQVIPKKTAVRTRFTLEEHDASGPRASALE